jgi:hypothetical protein
MAEDYIKQRTITSDGEIIGEQLKRYYNPFKEKRGYNYRYKSTVLKSYFDMPLPDKFTAAETGRLTWLSKHIYSSSNLLAKRRANTIVPLDREELRNIMQLGRSGFSTLINKTLKHGILKIIKLDNEEYFCFNPIYYNSTKYIPLYLFLAFQKELRGHLPDWVIQKYLDWAEDKPQEKETANVQ